VNFRSFIIVSSIGCLLLICGCLPAVAAIIKPFTVTNQGPLALPLGLPAPGDWRISAPGRTSVNLAVDLANTYTVEKTAREELLLDGESWRTTLTANWGIGANAEVGIELPYMGIGGGTFDGFIQGWHDFFGLPQGGRNTATKGQLRYRYRRDGVTRLDLTQTSSGFGDLRLTGGWQLLADEGGGVALRGAISLPTGNSHELRGSGTTSGSLWVTGGLERPVALGRLAAWGSLGGMVLGTGSILADQQRHVVGLGTIGGGWAPWELIDFKLQLNVNTPLYADSDLVPLSGYGVLLVMGGSLHLTPTVSLDIGVSEDLNVGSAADVALHCAVNARF
jgi:hypothetical protein